MSDAETLIDPFIDWLLTPEHETRLEIKPELPKPLVERVQHIHQCRSTKIRVTEQDWRCNLVVLATCMGYNTLVALIANCRRYIHTRQVIYLSAAMRQSLVTKARQTIYHEISALSHYFSLDVWQA